VVLDQRLQYVLGPGREGGPGQYVAAYGVAAYEDQATADEADAGDDLRRDPGRVDDDVARQGDQ
jgi:hypothetical protein